jgi:hypothetical protein
MKLSLYQRTVRRIKAFSNHFETASRLPWTKRRYSDDNPRSRIGQSHGPTSQGTRTKKGYGNDEENAKSPNVLEYWPLPRGPGQAKRKPLARRL